MTTRPLLHQLAIALTVTCLSTYSLCSRFSRKEKNYLQTKLKLKYNSFNKQLPIQVPLFQISFIREFELAKLGHKNLRCDTRQILDLLLAKLNYITKKMPVDLRIQVQVDLVSLNNTLLAFEIELEQVSIDVISRVLVFSYERDYALGDMDSRLLTRFADFHCEVSVLPENDNIFKFKVVMGDSFSMKQYYSKQDENTRV